MDTSLAGNIVSTEYRKSVPSSITFLVDKQITILFINFVFVKSVSCHRLGYIICATQSDRQKVRDHDVRNDACVKQRGQRLTAC